jgi:hypothetical protein
MKPGINWEPEQRQQIDPRQQCLERAQRDANRHGQPMSVLNLNTIGKAQYVVRAYQPEHETGAYAHQFVAKIEPNN